MFKRLICIGFLMLPGSFVLVGAACIVPRLRKKIVQFVDLQGLLDCIRSQCAVVRLPDMRGRRVAQAMAMLIARV
ncbi:hypothetical protein [Trinickia sp.]|uniref:hypothetical protein n=1 Tax=Trinickia sp. TaxID=2571163 RepID=UPI003F7F275A